MGTTYRELFKLYDLIQSGDSRAVEHYLKDKSIELNVILPCKGIGILHLAVGIEPVEKSKQCTELILKYGADPNLRNDDGVTPVHIAAIWGRLDNLKVLIGCGGDPFHHDLDGYSSFDYAAREEQWDVYDYLHNVIDEQDNSNGSQCAYTLDLERILVSTEQVVAEYEPAPNDVTRSDRIGDWCDEGLVINKLYPTILGETYLVDEKSRETIDRNRATIDSSRATIDRSRETIDRSRETIDRSRGTIDRLDNLERSAHSKSLDDTFQTCTSRKEVQISGIEPLQPISYISQESNSKQRFSEYENFSLPGSPNCVIHRNYHTKTSLKKHKSPQESLIAANSHKTCQNDLAKTSLKKSPQEELIAELKSKLSMRDTDSLLTDDVSQDLDKALIVAQNKTNEWLSSCSETDIQGGLDIKGGNTRRSSASSGVSSNFSGIIVLANVEEEYKYVDKEEDVVLIEKRLRVSPVVLPVDDCVDSPDQTVASIASSLPPTMDYDNKTLRAELISLGFNPGPIVDSTKSLYLKKLHTLKKNPILVRDAGSSKTYSVELQKSLRNPDWMQNLGPYEELEAKAKADFAVPSRKWREGCAKTSFTYLLLDPRLTDNLPAKAGRQGKHVSWSTFVNSIFYVGKGKRSRPYSHLYQALDLWKRDFKKTNDKKVQHILDIWSDKVGVLVLHIFQNVIPAEAFTNEAAMIDVLGLQNLKNVKTGDYYGVVASWPMKERKMFGLYLLYKAMNIFFSEGERQLRPEDID